MEKGEFVKINYTGRVAETGQLFDTTIKEDAEKENIRNPNAVYKALGVIIGEGFVIKGLDDSLAEHKPGDKYKIKIKPENAFGPRNPNFMRLIPLNVFKKKEVMPFPGMSVDIDDMVGIVRSVSGGRVIVDFNHPLAGKEIEYEVEIVEKIEKKEEKALLIAEYFEMKADSIEFKEDKATVSLLKSCPEQVKKKVAETMQKHLNLKEVDYVEKFKAD